MQALLDEQGREVGPERLADAAIPGRQLLEITAQRLLELVGVLAELLVVQLGSRGRLLERYRLVHNELQLRRAGACRGQNERAGVGSFPRAAEVVAAAADVGGG